MIWTVDFYSNFFFANFHSEISADIPKFASEMRVPIPKSIPKSEPNFGIYTEISEKVVGHIRHSWQANSQKHPKTKSEGGNRLT